MKLDQLLQNARLLSLKTGHLARSQYAGLYSSAFRGRGMEFAEVREYAEGDDIRLIDWNVSARSQSLYVKRMAEERERNVLVLLDATGSLAFGSTVRTKHDLLVEIAALMVLSGYASRDRVSLAIFRSKVDFYLPAAKGWNHALRLIREMVGRRPAGEALTLEPVWNFLNSPGVPRSLVLLFTDFQAPWQSSNSLAAACRKHEVVAFLASDPRERELPHAGILRVHDPETGEERVLNTNSKALREGFAAAARSRRAIVVALLRGCRVAWADFSTATEYRSSLRRFLELRSLKRGYHHP